jgi:hypothetical protein
VANGTTFALADALWLNKGNGQFTASSQELDLQWNEGAALADLDGENDLDVFLATWFGSDGVWINQGGAQGGKSMNQALNRIENRIEGQVYLPVITVFSQQ